MMKTPKPRTPKAEMPRTPSAPARKPMRTAGGRDVISTVTRMRETPTKGY